MVTIPTFKSTEDAYRFGAVATSEEINMLLVLIAESSILCDTLMTSATKADEAGHDDVFDSILNTASAAITKKQLYGEALQKAHEVATNTKCSAEDAVAYYQKGGD